MSTFAPAPAMLHELPNGARLLLLHDPHARTACVSVFVRTGSAHEPRALSGISHVIEHMAFKGTRTRDARRVNLDAETLGAEVNAHTDKDHTAYQMRGLAADAPAFVAMLGDIVLQPTFPADELERERQVLLQEFAEVDDDPMATAYQLFDRACWGLHAAALPVIGQRRTIERITREQLLTFVRDQYTGSNIVIAVAGPLDPQALLRAVEPAFGSVARGSPHRVAPPVYQGGVRTRRLDGGGQAHLVLGFPLPPLGSGDAMVDATSELAAAVLGEGMSSPLLDRLRERRGLVYHATAAADLYAVAGQFVVEASSAPERLGDVLAEVAVLLAAHAERIDPVDLERARRQLLVRRLQDDERPSRRLEAAVLDLFACGRVRSDDERLQALHAVDAESLRAAFGRMLAAGPAAALVGGLGRAAGEQARTILARHLGAVAEPIDDADEGA
ncbi:MAG: insulinase family protein [Rubrivivax sp.]|nr:insulinase family protein [Rubrivivax sp.]